MAMETRLMGVLFEIVRCGLVKIKLAEENDKASQFHIRGMIIPRSWHRNDNNAID